jgi:hypothetical protein
LAFTGTRSLSYLIPYLKHNIIAVLRLTIEIKKDDFYRTHSNQIAKVIFRLFEPFPSISLLSWFGFERSSDKIYLLSHKMCLSSNKHPSPLKIGLTLAMLSILATLSSSQNVSYAPPPPINFTLLVQLNRSAQESAFIGSKRL